MKKVLSLLLAVVMVIGMLPLGVLTASAAETTETMAIAATTGTVSGESISWTSGNLTFTANKNTSSNAIRTSDSDHFRLYVGFSATLTCAAGNITKIEMVATGSSYAIAPTGSDGSVGTVSGTTITIVPNDSSNTYTISSITKQTRIKSITVTYADVASGDCAHTNTEAIEAKEPTCLLDGNTAGVKCTDCGATVSGNEKIAATGHTEGEGVVTAATCTEDGYTTYTCTVCGNKRKADWVVATGHTYVDGTCSACGIVKPTGLDGEYYIAAIRSSGNYQYMTNDLGTASTQRYQIVDSGLTTLPESIETTVDAQVFELVASGDGYKIKAGDQYLGWTSGNSGTLVDEATAIVATIENGEAAGSYTIHFAASDAERYLSLNSNATNAYYAWYKPGQVSDLYLVPVATGAEACTHTNTTSTTVDATCTTDGSVTVTCADCGETISTETIEATGHNYVDGTCSSCGDVEVVAPSNSEATISFATTDQRLSQDTSTQVWSNDGLTVTNNKAASTSNIIDSSNPVRFYKSSELVFAFKGMTKIEVTCNTADYATALVNSISDDNAAVTSNGTVVTIVLENAVDTFTVAALSAQVRVNSITVYAEVPSDCTHEWGDWVDTTAPTCTTAGVQTATCTLCGQTKTQDVAATGHTYTVSGDTVTCACGSTLTISTIAEAKAFTDATAIYCVKGIVTYVSYKNVYIEDATGGILVYCASAPTDIALGDEIVVWDCLTTYNGLIETTNTTDTEYAKLSSGNTLPSQTVTLAQLLADTTNEYLSERVVIENVTMGTINTSGNTALTDADGNTLSIYKVSGLSEDINEGDTVTVTAIVSTFKGYQLLINPGTAATDVVETAAGEETVVETVSIATAKAGEAGTYYQVEGVVTFIDGRNVYIQDATGGIVAYLTTNNTTAAIGDKIKAYGALKTYNGLIELDGIDQTNTEFFEVLSSGNTVEAQNVTVAELLADSANEYLAEKVTIKNAYISEVGSWSSSYLNVNYTITAGNSSIVIYRAPAATEADVLSVGTIVSLEAIVSAYNGYQLRIVSADSITATAPVCMVNGVPYETMTEALANYTAGSYVKLMQDAEVNVTLTSDLYIDLNGRDLTGVMVTNGFKVYGMDASTDEFTTQAMGYFTCVDENDEDIVPETIVETSVTGKVRRYLAIYDPMAGYSFHRFYLGITHATVKPGTKGVGYKAIFAGDDMVKAQISSFGYTLQLEGNDAVTQSKAGTEMVSMETVTLRVDNYDAEKYGTTDLSASVFMVIGDQTITADAVTMNLKTMVEAINAMTLDDAQKAAMAAWIADSETMKTWDVSNIYTAA